MKKESAGKNTLIYIVAGVFLVQIAVWGTWIFFANKHRPKEVPLKSQSAAQPAHRPISP